MVPKRSSACNDQHLNKPNFPSKSPVIIKFVRGYLSYDQTMYAGGTSCPPDRVSRGHRVKIIIWSILTISEGNCTQLKCIRTMNSLHCTDKNTCTLYTDICMANRKADRRTDRQTGLQTYNNVSSNIRVGVHK